VIARVVLWSLADADATFGELRDAIDDEPADIPGRLFEAWISDETSERWGTVFRLRHAGGGRQGAGGPGSAR
jgi:hypothetical protein